MSNTDQCKDIKELSILCETLLNLAITNIKKKGINPLIVETYRSQERQNYLYAQGRTRDLKSPKITWTLNSIHTLRNAVDIVPQRIINGKMTAIWNASDKETLEIIKTMEKYGFEAGANWTNNIDSPHFQIKGVSSSIKEYSEKNNNQYITIMIQKALNQKIGVKLTADGAWGNLTTKTVNDFKKRNNWSVDGKLDSLALKTLIK